MTSVLHVSLEPARPHGAAEAHLRAIARGLATSGFDVTPLWRCESRTLVGLPHFASGLLRRGRRADLIYARWHPLDLLTPAVARLHRVPLVWEVNGLTDDLLSNRPKLRALAPAVRALARRTLRHGTVVICVSHGLADAVRSHLPQSAQVAVIPNGAEVPHPPRQPASSNDRRSRPYVLYFGELAARQGIAHVLAARHSAHWPPDVDLVLAGDGPLRDLLAQHSQHGCLQVLGKIPQQQLQTWIQHACATLSLQDPTLERNSVMGLPLKVAESLMLGTPVIASPLSDVPSALASQPDHFLVDPEDPEQVCQAVAHSVGVAPSLRELLMADARKRLSWDIAVSRTVTVLSAIPPR